MKIRRLVKALFWIFGPYQIFWPESVGDAAQYKH